MHARGSGEAARRAKRGRQPEKKKRVSFFVPLQSRAISHTRGHLRVSRFARRTTEKRETARSLVALVFKQKSVNTNCKQTNLAPVVYNYWHNVLIK